uniref:DOG1 domain-containing protein n=1 Tax=Oryza nivara TaxID=4536 RepID=A0A0E0H6L2_ORYNI
MSSVRYCLGRDFQPAAAAAAYFGELEEALIHGANAGGVVDPGMIRADVHSKSAAAAATAGYLAARPPTLEIFPSWPMRQQQQLHSGNSQSVGSTTDSSSAQNTMPQMELVSPASIRASSEHQHQQQQPGQEVMMVTTDDYSYKPGLAAASPSFQQQHQLQHHQQQQLHGGDHDKRKHGSTRKDGKSVDAKVGYFLDMYLLAPVSFLTWLNLLGRWVFSDRTEISAKQRGCEEEQAEKKGDEKKPVNSNFKTSSKDCFPIACLCAKPRDQQGQASADRARTPKSTQQLQPASLQLADEGVPRSSHHGAVKSFAGAAMFDMEYARWLDDDSKRLTDLRGGLQAHLLDTNLGLIVEECMQHYDELFQLKAALARSDVFHLLTGTWATPAERCFLWMGGFRPSDLLKILIQQLDPLTEQQMLGIYSLQQSSEQAEEALAQGLQQLHQSLADTVAAGTLNDGPGVPNYMSLMAIALDKLASLESFYQQADNLRQQTLHQLRRILTTRQAARCFLSIGEYYRRLRALSNLWSSRPRENFIGTESVSPTGTELQPMHNQPQQNQYSGF